MNWSNKKVIVTGAGGFIGSHLCERLVSEGAEVTAFLRYTSTPHNGLLNLLPENMVNSIRIIRGDLRDPDAVQKACYKQDIVFHLGALIAIPYSYIHPTEVAEVNTMGTINLLNAARHNDVERVIHTSTSEVYGTAKRDLIDESHPLTGQSPYSASKIGADALAEAYQRSFGLPVATIRPFNTYGPRQSGRAVIPTIIGQALSGDQVCLGSLSPTRDLNYVTDTVEGYLAVAQCEQAIGEVINIGSGKEISIGELAKLIIKRIGREIPVVSQTERMRPPNSEVFRLICDASKAKQLANWEPQVSLEQGIDQVIDFMRAHPGWVITNDYQV